ncbi:MAG: hypothetical protein HY690_04815 [Chloroflexi bacterium]|nr:hypothetical protein [Chloroflexota bacterium]
MATGLATLALLVALGGEWGTAFGQTVAQTRPAEPLLVIGVVSDLSVLSSIALVDTSKGDAAGIIDAARGRAEVKTGADAPVQAVIDIPSPGDTRVAAVVQTRALEQLAPQDQPAVPTGFLPLAVMSINVLKLNDLGQPTGERVTQHRAPVTISIEVDEAMWTAAGGDPSLLAILRTNPGTGDTERLPCAYTPPPPEPYGTLTCQTTRTSTFVVVVQPKEMAVQSVATADTRYFLKTFFRVNNDQVWDYFNKRGGVDTFGYPISRPFVLDGTEVQVFQRQAIQVTPDGSVHTLNLLDPGLMPFTSLNRSILPGVDEGLKGSAPRVDEPDYDQRIVDFVRQNAPDEFEGLPVNFFQTFMNTVQCQQAFPDGDCREDLLPLLNLELWGAPTSRPARDPNNPNFVYQRFQRGIMHFDRTTGLTQGLLIGDYFKSILTGENLPPDLAQQARDSRFFKQYLDIGPAGLVSPAALPGTDLKGAFETDLPRESVRP